MEIQLNDVKYKLVFNTNSLEDFEEETGINPLAKFDLKIKTVKSMAYHAVIEDCRLRGDKKPPSKKDVGGCIFLGNMREVFQAFSETLPEEEKKKTGKK